MRRVATLLLFLAGLAATLALPGRRGGGASAEEAAFAALVLDGSRAGAGGLAPEERQRLLETLRKPGAPALARFLEAAVASSAAEAPRRVALECLEGCASAREVGALVRLAAPGAGAPSSALRAALRSALLRTLERDARAFRELVPAWRDTETELRTELLAVVGERGDPAGLELLAWVATFEGEEFHRALAEACLRLAPRARNPESRAHLETLCGLLDSGDGACVQRISSALARARVEAAIPAWIELLASESRGTRARARSSLEELTGLALGETGERWRSWYEAERTWFERRAPDLLAELESEDDARVLAAVRALSCRRLRRDELAQAVSGLLDHGNPAVRLCACSALGSLASPGAVPALVSVLADEDEDVARAAWSTLRALSGLDLPPDEALWRARIAGS